MRMKSFCFFLLGFFLSFQVFALNAPVRLEPVQAAYRKITIKWENGDAGQVASYRIYRNQTEIATVTGTQYTDSNLETGTQYTYEVVAVGVGGDTSSPSGALAVSTIKSVTFDNSGSVEQVVDSLHPVNSSNITGLTLLSAVKSGLEALLSTNITFSAVDSDILTNFVEQELTVIKEVEPSMTDAERLAAQTELNTVLNDGFGGNSFEHVYIQGKLAELAETHYQKGFKVGAAALYELSLNYLKDQEPVVFGTLSRLASFKIDALTDTSTRQEIAAAMAEYNSTFLRFFEYFPNSTSLQAQSACVAPARKYFRYFPVLLDYDSYNTTAFANALQQAQTALQLNSNVNSQKFYDRIAAWELVQQTIEFKDSSNNPLNGSITVRNITANTALKDVFPGDPYEEERTIQVVNGQANFPIYKGHIYSAIAHFNVEGGNQLNYAIETFAHEKGKTVTYNNTNAPVSANLPAGTNYAKSSFVFDSPNYPYNLTYERAIDVLTLHWEWVAPSGFTLKNFKVFCGGNVVATVIGTSASNVLIQPDGGAHAYTVVAYDVNDNPSGSSLAVNVFRDNAGYAGYFAWLQQHFGNQDMYSCDDPDLDNSDNYHEYLNGTDPARVPGPAMLDCGQVSYSKAVLNWNQMFAGEAGVTYKIYRNDTEITTTSATTFTDTGLTPGVAFIYRVKALKQDGSDTEQGAPLTVRTIAPVTFNGSDKVQQVVDSILPASAAQYTGSTLITAVKSGIEALCGSSVTFSTVSDDILTNFVNQELAVINEIVPTMTEAERLTAKTDLSAMLNDNFGGNSFEHVYIQGKLTELAEQYYIKGDKEMGTALYELSLNYLKNMETSVFGSLSRLAAFKCDALTEESTNEQIIAALDAYRDTFLRFFTFFPDSTSQQAQQAYVMPEVRYFKYFPMLLKYDNYNQSVFNSAKQLSEAALALNGDDGVMRYSMARHIRISSWELSSMNVTFENSDSGPVAGNITIRNTSKDIFPGDPVTDERQFQLDGSPLVIPVYAGHTYDLTVSFDVPGGTAIKYNIADIAHTPGQKVVYDHFNDPVAQSLPEGSTIPEVMFITGKPQCPYNLSSQLLPDEFTLSWDWLAPNTGYQLKYFKIYRGVMEVGTATQQQLEHIPRVVVADSAYAYTVVAYDINDNPSPASPALVVLPNFTAEEQKYFAWKQKYLGNTPALASDDSDGDGLTNYQEYQLGSNPALAPVANPKESLIDIVEGANIAYYCDGVTGNQFPNFNALQPYKTEIASLFCFNNTSGVVLNSGRSDNVGVVIQGFFDVPETGTYKFYISNDDGCKIYIDDALALENSRVASAQECFADRYLTQGVHKFRIEYLEITYTARLNLMWAGSRFSKASFDTASIWHTSREDAAMHEAIAWQRDTDSDGISDSEEMRLGLNWQSSDTDGDGVSDGEEIKEYHTDPAKADTDGDGIGDYEEIFLAETDPNQPDWSAEAFEKVQELNGADFVSAGGEWVKEGNFARSTAVRGWLDYKLNVSSANLFKLSIEVQGYYQLPADTEIDVYVDGVFAGQYQSEISNDKVNSLEFYTPWLTTGEHNVKIFWDNYNGYSSLVVCQLRLMGIKSVDANNDGIPDVAANMLNSRCHINPVSSSRTSPVCFEGTARFPELVTVNKKLKGNDPDSSDGGPLPVRRLSKDGWYLDVELDPGSTNKLVAKFESGTKKIVQPIKWEETNLLVENGKTFTVRKGDSLLLNAHPDGKKKGSYQINYNGQTLSGTIDKPAALKFDTPGIKQIDGKYISPKDKVTECRINVEVIEYDFGKADIACWLERGRDWDVPDPGEKVQLSFDARLQDSSVVPAETGSTDLVRVFSDDNKPRYAVARLGDAGPVMNVQQISAVGIYSSELTYVREMEQYADGSKLYEMLVVESPVRSDVELRLNIFVAGVVFDDGSVSKTLTAADFDQQGNAKVNFIRPPEAQTSVCHSLTAYQNGGYMGVRTK